MSTPELTIGEFTVNAHRRLLSLTVYWLLLGLLGQLFSAPVLAQTDSDPMPLPTEDEWEPIHPAFLLLQFWRQLSPLDLHLL
jgi:hypothetical protein